MPNAADKGLIEFADDYSLHVAVIWLTTWMCALGLSVVARWQARKHRSVRWSRWALLPVYEIAICFQKSSLLLILILDMIMCIDNSRCERKHHCNWDGIRC